MTERDYSKWNKEQQDILDGTLRERGRSEARSIIGSMDRKVRVQRQREVKIHAELWQTSDLLLEAGQLRSEGAAHQFRASFVFRAFYLEAFLNWLGPKLIPHWKYLERLTPREKLE